MSGAPTPDTSATRRISKLERDIRDLQESAGPGRELQKGSHRDEILAYTVSGQSGAYPDPTGTGSPKFPIKFIDATFTQSPGWETLVTQNRGDPTADYDQIAASITGEWIKVGSLVKVLWQRPPSGISTEDGGEWFIEPYAGSDPVLLSPVVCFASYPQIPTAMYLWEVVDCVWTKTSTVVYAEDPNDTNYLLPDETQEARIRPGCTFGTGEDERPLYDLVGSRGLYRRVKTYEQIECGAFGNATIHEVDDCTAEAPAGCLIEVCNNWGHRRCIPAEEEIQARYLKRGIWDAVYNDPNVLYTAYLAGNIEAGVVASVGVSQAEPFEKCEPNSASNITSAINILGLAGVVGDTVLIIKNRALCDGGAFIANVSHKCRDIAVTGDDCGGTVFVRQECEDIIGRIQRKVAIQTSETYSEEFVQITLEEHVGVTGGQYSTDGCSVKVTRQYGSIYGFSSLGCVTPTADDTATIITFTKALAVVSQEFDNQEVDGVCTPIIKNHQQYFLQIVGCTDGTAIQEFGLTKKTVMVGVTQVGDCKYPVYAEIPLIGPQCGANTVDTEELLCVEEFVCPPLVRTDQTGAPRTDQAGAFRNAQS